MVKQTKKSNSFPYLFKFDLGLDKLNFATMVWFWGQANFWQWVIKIDKMLLSDFFWFRNPKVSSLGFKNTSLQCLFNNNSIYPVYQRYRQAKLFWWFEIGSNPFLLQPICFKNKNHFKSGQKWPENNHLSIL